MADYTPSPFTRLRKDTFRKAETVPPAQAQKTSPPSNNPTLSAAATSSTVSAIAASSAHSTKALSAGNIVVKPVRASAPVVLPTRCSSRVPVPTKFFDRSPSPPLAKPFAASTNDLSSVKSAARRAERRAGATASAYGFAFGGKRWIGWEGGKGAAMKGESDEKTKEEIKDDDQANEVEVWQKKARESQGWVEEDAEKKALTTCDADDNEDDEDEDNDDEEDDEGNEDEDNDDEDEDNDDEEDDEGNEDDEDAGDDQESFSAPTLSSVSSTSSVAAKATTDANSSLPPHLPTLRARRFVRPRFELDFDAPPCEEDHSPSSVASIDFDEDGNILWPHLQPRRNEVGDAGGSGKEGQEEKEVEGVWSIVNDWLNDGA